MIYGSRIIPDNVLHFELPKPLVDLCVFFVKQSYCHYQALIIIYWSFFYLYGSFPEFTALLITRIYFILVIEMYVFSWKEWP